MNSSMLVLAMAAKATVVLAAACGAIWALRKASSSARYFVWSCALVAILAIPFLSVTVRQLEAPIPIFSAITDGAQSIDNANVPPVRESPWRLPSLQTLWLAGVMVALARVLIGHAGAYLSLRRTEAIPSADWLNALADASSRVGLRRSVSIRRSLDTDVPLTYGLLRPVVLLPAGSEHWEPERRRVVLMHELVHVRRFDALLSLAGQIARAVYWFHPLAWFALSRFRQEQERSCDDAVVRAGAGQSTYAGHLVSFARSLTANAEWPAALGMADTNDLEQRVRAILDPRRNRRALNRSLGVAAACALAVCIIPLAAVRAQETRGTASLTGSVYDASGAAVPYAIVSLKTADGAKQEITRSDGGGEYRFERIAAGNYTMEAKAPGFAPFQQANIVLTTTAPTRLDAKLVMGQVNETLEVVGKVRVRHKLARPVVFASAAMCRQLNWCIP